MEFVHQIQPILCSCLGTFLANCIDSFSGHSFTFHSSDAGGHPFSWAQTLCGLEFPPTDEQRLHQEQNPSRPRLGTIIPMVLERCHAWADLNKTLYDFSLYRLPSFLSPVESVRIMRWVEVAQSKYKKFEVKMERTDKTSLIAHISLLPGYPAGSSPKFVLDLSNKEQAEEIERRLNAISAPKTQGHKLAHQVHFLMQELSNI
jgi:hypothetical protein